MKSGLSIWIWFCAYLNCAGWFLSAIKQLNAAGYAVTLAVWVVSLFIGKNLFGISSPFRGRPLFRKMVRRFKRPLPLAFLILFVMAFLGGALYAPTNYDALSYRVSRVLDWLAAGQWYWIHTIFPRVNASSCGIEWISAPLIALFRTDRLLFLINIVSFLFLPGLVFSILIRFGIRRRVVWHWMWIAPTGYCFLLQAGSIGNDLFGAPFALGAIDFALRAKTSRRGSDVFCSVLAAALMTGAKFANLPLLLPWAIAILPSLRVLLQRPLATALVCVVALFASFIPKAVINNHYCGDWSGVSLEYDQPRNSEALRTGANVALLAVLNLTPPVFPPADRWDKFVQKTIPPGLNERLRQSLTESGAYELKAPDMQVEENAGLGFGVTVLLMVSVVGAAVSGRKRLSHVPLQRTDDLWRMAIMATPWISLLAFLTRSMVYPIGRILAPFYPLLLPLLLLSPGHERLVKKLWWHVAVFAVFVMAAGLLIVSPARPLFPVGILLKKIEASHSHSKLLTRIHDVYNVYHHRNNGFQPVLDILPPDTKILGYIAYDEPETTLWHPFGSRRVVDVCPNDSPADLKARGMEYILAEGERFGQEFPNLDAWLKTMNAEVVQKIPLELRASYGATDWYLIKLN